MNEKENKKEVDEIIIYKYISNNSNIYIKEKDIIDYFEKNNLKQSNFAFKEFILCYKDNFEMFKEYNKLNTYLYKYLYFLNCFTNEYIKNAHNFMDDYNIIYDAILNIECCYHKDICILTVGSKNPIYLLYLYLQYFNVFNNSKEMLNTRYLLLEYLVANGQRFYLNQLETKEIYLKSKTFYDFINKIEQINLNHNDISNINNKILANDLVDKCINYKRQIKNKNRNCDSFDLKIGIIGKTKLGTSLINVKKYLLEQECINLIVNNYIFQNELGKTFVEDEKKIIQDLENKYDLEQIILNNDIVIIQEYSNLYERIINYDYDNQRKKIEALNLLDRYVNNISNELKDVNEKSKEDKENKIVYIFDALRNYYKILANLNEMALKTGDISYKYNSIILKNLNLIFK